MADSKLTALTEVSAPELEDLLYLVEDPTGTPTSRKISAQRLAGLGGFLPGGRLTLTTGTPVTTSDVTAAGTLYYTPYLHNRVRVWDGTRWLYKVFAEISLALTLTSGKNYDVFLDDDAATLVLSAAWTNDTTRADALGTQDGVQVLNSDKTKLWLGTIRASAANQCTDSGEPTAGTTPKRFVWNKYNQVLRHLRAIEDANTWSYTTDTIRQANGDATNQVEYVTGDAATTVFADVRATMFGQNNALVAGKVGVGVDSTTAFSGLSQGGFAGTVATGNYSALGGSYMGMPGLGYHKLCWLEKGPDGTGTWIGDNGGDGQQSGINAWLMM